MVMMNGVRRRVSGVPLESNWKGMRYAGCVIARLVNCVKFSVSFASMVECSRK